VTFVIEVGYAQSMQNLVDKATRWLTETSCEVVVLLKISKKGKKYRAQVHRKGYVNPVQNLSFNLLACVGLGTHVLTVKYKSIFGVPANIPAALVGGGPLTIDLFPVVTSARQAYLR